MPAEALRRLACAALLAWAALAGAAGAPALAESCPMPAQPPAATAVPLPAPEKRPQLLEIIRRELANGKEYGAVALGDSIMRGWPAGPLEQALGTRVLNAAVGGDGSGRVLWKLDTLDWSRQRPALVFVLVGTNNLRRPPCEVYWGIRAVVRRAHELFPQARVIVSAILPRGPRLLEFDDRITAVNAALREGAAGRDYALFDAHDRLRCGNVTPCRLFQDNLLHLTPEGYAALTEALAEFMRRPPASR